jgi:hypothetical protein
MAIVASGYLFADELAYHVDVFQGDTPSGLLSRYAPGAQVVSAAVLDIDVPGQTCPLELEPDEPVVVVGASPRTSVFVYGETPSSVETKALQEGGLVCTQVVQEEPPPTTDDPTSPPTSPTLHPPPLADIPTEPKAVGGAPAKETASKAVDTEKSYPKTRRMRKPKITRGTRRAPKTLKIEMA